MMTGFENASSLALSAMVTLMVIAICIFAWGIYKLVRTIVLLVSSKGHDSRISGYMSQVIQFFLIGLVALFLALSLYLEFFGKPNLSPGSLADYNSALIIRLGILIVLIVAGHMIKRLIDGRRRR